ncbi:MAG: hypothetical protein AB7W16_19560 [Candidatus Obscuribacterales bacterium]
MRRKALLAIAFAGGLLGNQLPVLAEPAVEPSKSLIQELVSHSEVSPEERAYWLLRLAVSYLSDGNTPELGARYRQIVSNLVRRSRPLQKHSERMYVAWAEQISAGVMRADDGTKHKIEWRTDARQDESVVLADTAIRQALSQLDQTKEEFAKLHLYFIASRLLRMTGDRKAIQQCDREIEEFFQSCEGPSPAGEERIKAAVSVLNLMAYGIVPIHIPDLEWEERFGNRKGKIEPVSDRDVEESERLKLRSAAMVDKLPSDSHLRRKTHRDLALWYIKLGKTEKGEREKQILFGLVGCFEDRILYPKSPGCGRLIWWQVEPMAFMSNCGMG